MPPRLPKVGDVIRRNFASDAWPTHWYGVVVELLDEQPGELRFGYRQLGGNIIFLRREIQYDENNAGDSWSYADPNREDSTDIPPGIWELRKQIRERMAA